MKLIKDSIWSLASIAIPALVAIPVFSLINKSVGLELFGLYTLSFAIIGYASIFDLGLSRAVIREVAMNIGNHDIIRDIMDTSFCMMLILSIIAGISVFLFVPVLIDMLNISLQYQDDVKSGFIWLALSLPLLLISQNWLAYFEGLSEFKYLSIVKGLSNTLIVILPYLATFFSESFTALMIGMFVGRLIVFLIGLCWIKNYLIFAFHFDKPTAKRLINFGGWFAVSGIISPIMVYFDRFILSSLMGARNIAFYTAPSELVMRMLALPSAGSRVLFARFSNVPKGNEKQIYWLSIIIFALCAVMFVAPMIIFAKWVLMLWLGEQFAGDSVVVLQILLIGFIFNAVAQVPFVNLQAKGLSKQTALVHCFELVPYIIILYVLIELYGIIGVAIAWSIRVFVDMAIFLYLDSKIRLNYE